MANEFVRPGKGLINDQRCAAAVYRHLVRHGEDVGLGFGVSPKSEEVFALSHPDNELDAIAWDWIELGEGAEPSRDDLEIAHALTSGPRLAAALASSVEMRHAWGKAAMPMCIGGWRSFKWRHSSHIHAWGAVKAIRSIVSPRNSKSKRRKSGFPKRMRTMFRELSQQIALETPDQRAAMMI